MYKNTRMKAVMVSRSPSLYFVSFSRLSLSFFLLQYACDRNVSINVRNVMQCVCLSSFVIINFRIFRARCRCQRQGCLKHLSYIFIVCCFAIVIYTVFLVILLLLLLWHDGVRRERKNDCVLDQIHANWNVFSWLVRVCQSVFVRPKSTQRIEMCCILMTDTIWPWLWFTFV